MVRRPEEPAQNPSTEQLLIQKLGKESGQGLLLLHLNKRYTIPETIPDIYALTHKKNLLAPPDNNNGFIHGVRHPLCPGVAPTTDNKSHNAFN